MPRCRSPSPGSARVGILAAFSSSRQNVCLAHSPFLGVPVLAWVESPSRSLAGDALGPVLSSCAESRVEQPLQPLVLLCPCVSYLTPPAKAVAPRGVSCLRSWHCVEVVVGGAVLILGTIHPVLQLALTPWLLRWRAGAVSLWLWWVLFQLLWQVSILF